MDNRAFFKPATEVTLSTREVEIAQLMAEAWSNQTIADRLCIDVRTVENHINNIYQKMRDRFNCEGRNSRVYLSLLYRQMRRENN